MPKIKLKRQPKPKKPALPAPGCMVLPEDSRMPTARMKLPPQPPRTPAPRVKSSKVKVSRTEVEGRLMTAMRTLRAMPDRERRFFIVKSSSPDYVQESVTAYASVEDIGPRFQPSPADVSDCLYALAWVRHLDRAAWQILWWRSFELSFGVIGKYIGRSDETARKRFETAITDAWIAANV
ncbi:DUF6362 family protein [Neorhizobium sp. NCHU2750]|uniref:DUF6362 family protein n=1 Tax=Neorhizobium sp. NCHU2750 TaxID=1825976 RepID=UPI000EB68440|nr:hypothetical protein NCHU2750_28290 [Neorhizobium sp. NCHU2750]